jgi:hypothetical protein
MPLFGSKKTPQDKVREANEKMKQITQQKYEAKITEEQAIQHFYTILKNLRNDIPPEAFANPDTLLILQDKSGLDIEPNFWYTSILRQALQKLRTGQ